MIVLQESGKFSLYNIAIESDFHVPKNQRDPHNAMVFNRSTKF